MDASLVYDGDELIVPSSMGEPLPDQLQGTPLERLGELASRICYDSLGNDPDTGKRRGRSSEALHKHILEVKNHSVYEHCVFTVVVPMHTDEDVQFIRACGNRKGVWLEQNCSRLEITVNFRAVLEWEQNTNPSFNGQSYLVKPLGEMLRHYGRRLAPMIFGERPTRTTDDAWELIESSFLKEDGLSSDQAHVTLWLYGSRGFTHEQVRHRFAMSQRSTRYVDEDGSPYITHPLVEAFLNDERAPEVNRGLIRDQIMRSTAADRVTYRDLVEALQEYCREQMGITDKTAARKQARGAARGYLGNALASEMLFTASISGWKWILRNRKNKLADAEIRQVYSPALDALKASQYGDRFNEFKIGPSPDGLGTVLV